MIYPTFAVFVILQYIFYIMQKLLYFICVMIILHTLIASSNSMKYMMYRFYSRKGSFLYYLIYWKPISSTKAIFPVFLLLRDTYFTTCNSKKKVENPNIFEFGSFNVLMPICSSRTNDLFYLCLSSISPKGIFTKLLDRSLM